MHRFAKALVPLIALIFCLPLLAADGCGGDDDDSSDDDVTDDDAVDDDASDDDAMDDDVGDDDSSDDDDTTDDDTGDGNRFDICEKGYNSGDGFCYAHLADPVAGEEGLGMVVDSTGTAHVVATRGRDLLHYSRDLSAKNDGWTEETIRQNAGGWTVGVDADDALHIAFNDDLSHRLIYAIRPAGNEWQFETVEDNGKDKEWIKIAVEPDGTPHISFTDEDYQSAKYATNESGEWAVQELFTIGSSGIQNRIAVTSAGVVHILHHGRYRGSNGDWETDRKVLHHTNASGDWKTWWSRFPVSWEQLAVDENDTVHWIFGDGTAYAPWQHGVYQSNGEWDIVEKSPESPNALWPSDVIVREGRVLIAAENGYYGDHFISLSSFEFGEDPVREHLFYLGDSRHEAEAIAAAWSDGMRIAYFDKADDHIGFVQPDGAGGWSREYVAPPIERPRHVQIVRDNIANRTDLLVTYNNSDDDQTGNDRLLLGRYSDGTIDFEELPLGREIYAYSTPRLHVRDGVVFIYAADNRERSFFITNRDGSWVEQRLRFEGIENIRLSAIALGRDKAVHFLVGDGLSPNGKNDPLYYLRWDADGQWHKELIYQDPDSKPPSVYAFALDHSDKFHLLTSGHDGKLAYWTNRSGNWMS
ncbi:hypothetical protein KDL45_15270, partial [bacterium]|nr:hypothetical protein [bacterium]